MTITKRDPAVEAPATSPRIEIEVLSLDNDPAAPRQPAEDASCCAPSEQATCCEPAAKASCCGNASTGGCGCR